MRTLLLVIALLIAAPLLAAAGILVFDAPVSPPPVASLENAFDNADFSTLPNKSAFTARDGTKLNYRAYPGSAANVVVLIHGSSGSSSSMHLLAEAIHRRGASVYALTMRGHGGTGRSGDIDYVGQLDEDVAGFMKTLPPRRPGDRRTLLGFSSGGGFAMRFAGGPYGKLFDRFVFVSPALPYDAPTMRDGGGNGGQDSKNAAIWVVAAVPRIIVLSILSQFGIHVFEGLPVLAFGVPPEMRNVQTAFYSFRMWQNFGATRTYLDDLRRTPGPVSLFVGAKDELFYPERFSPLLKPARPDLAVTILPNMMHMDMTIKPAAVSLIAAKIASQAS